MFASGNGAEYWVVGSDGVARQHISWGEPGVRVRRDDYLALVKQDAVNFSGLELRLAAKRAARYASRLNETLVDQMISDEIPAVTQLLVDNEDRVWVRGFDGRSWPNGMSPVWIVFDTIGRYLDSVHVPFHFVFEIHDRGILGSWFDEDGREHLGVGGIRNGP